MIPIPNPINVPATPELTADSLWISSLTISAPTTTGKIAVKAILVPQVSSTGTLLLEKSKVLTIPDLTAAGATDPNITAAMTAIYAAVNSQAVAKKLFPAS